MNIAVKAIMKTDKGSLLKLRTGQRRLNNTLLKPEVDIEPLEEDYKKAEIMRVMLKYS